MNLVYCIWLNKGAKISCGEHGIIHCEVVDMFGEFGTKFIVDILVYDESFGGNAALPIVLDTSENCMGYGEVKIGIIKDDERVAATEFEDDFFKMGSCSSCYRATRGGTAGERYRSDLGIFYEGICFFCADKQ